MARERSHVRKKRRGCLSGCLTNLLLALGLVSLLFVGACVLGFVKNDPQTGKPSLSLDGLKGLENVKLPEIDLSDVKLPAWAYGVSRTGLTVKTLRAGSGEAVLVCADGYTMLLGGGSGMGAALTGQLLLCGVNHLNAVAAMGSQPEQIGGLPLAVTLMPPQYLLFQNTQTKGTAYNRLMTQAQKKGSIQAIVPKQGLAFYLGRALVTVVGPARTVHTDERNDGLSIRIDYGNTSVLVMGGIAASGERELIASRVNLDADALICAQGGGEEATCAELVSAVSPRVALMTGKNPANTVKVRLTRAGAQVYTAKEHGVMTLVSDGQTIQVQP
ncbi:MAG: hypothetical protein U0J65_12330 [Christensenellales bacterium]|nr:hypothetical protein [Christensenellales bacterium]